MKKILFSLIIAIITIHSVFAQSRLKIGGGYFGQTITHPGIVLEVEYETNVSKTMSLPFRVDVGIYHHPRNHDGLFADASYGLRRYYKSGLFLEESIGVGILCTVLNEDVYVLDNNGNVSETSKLNSPQFMPSLTLGIGYNLSKDPDRPLKLLWVRPKISWETPHKTTASFSPSIQIGFTHQINKK